MDSEGEKIESIAIGRGGRHMYQIVAEAIHAPLASKDLKMHVCSCMRFDFFNQLLRVLTEWYIRVPKSARRLRSCSGSQNRFVSRQEAREPLLDSFYDAESRSGEIFC